MCGEFLKSEVDVVGIVSDGRPMVQAALELHPDLIVADIAMPILNGLDTTTCWNLLHRESLCILGQPMQEYCQATVTFW